MFRIETHDLGKRFAKEWIFRSVSLQLQAGQKVALTGGNGSGKTTLLKTLSGMIPRSEGMLCYTDAQGRPIPEGDWWRHLCWSGPYTELIEEMTLLEFLSFYTRFKPLQLPHRELVAEMGLERAAHKLLRDYSSGMKQKVKLGLCFWGEEPLLLLDEPTSNLDHRNTDWYLQQVEKPMPGRLLLLASNQPLEYACCGQVLQLEGGQIREITR